jgi:predicted Zn-dependent protease
MAKGGNGKTPEFLSTHPAETTRIEKLKVIMPEAVGYYEKAIRKG